MDPNIEEAVQQLKGTLDQITAHDPAALATGTNLGSINFEDGVGVFRAAIELAKELSGLPLELLPPENSPVLRDQFQSLTAALDAVRDFKLTGQNDAQQRDALLNKTREQFASARQVTYPHIPYLTLRGAKIEEIARRSTELFEQVRDQMAEALDSVRARVEEVEAIVQAVRDAAAASGASQYAPKFKETAKEHHEASRNWLWAAGILGTATAFLAVGFLWAFEPADTIGSAKAVQQLVTKLVVLSVVYYAAVWSSRNYRAHRHLSVVNEHRADALTTFETFVAGSSEPQTKDAVLLEAVHSIFSPAATGYIGKDGEAPDNRVVDVIRRALGSRTDAS